MFHESACGQLLAMLFAFISMVIAVVLAILLLVGQLTISWWVPVGLFFWPFMAVFFVVVCSWLLGE